MGDRRYEIKDELGAVKYVLKFKDINHSKYLYSAGDGKNLFLIGSAMRCSLDYPDGTYLGLGTSYRFHSDKFDRKRGERVALKDALSLHNDKLQREARRFIWAEYFKLRPIRPEPSLRDIRKAKRREAMKSAPGERLARKIGKCIEQFGEEATRAALEQMINSVRPADETETTQEAF
jgi:hypothetical protein